VIDEQVRKTLPSLGGPAAAQRDLRPGGQSRIRYDVQRFRGGPDNDVRLFVRARWAAAGSQHWIGLSLWLRAHGDDFLVEAIDASATRFAEMPESRVFETVVGNPVFAGVILNVVPAADGWASVIVGRRGYESRSADVLKYSPDGPIATGVAVWEAC
jgi:hypothetical protein